MLWSMERFWIRLGGCFAFLAIALGAFGAHGLKDLLMANAYVDVWHTAANYQLVHAVAMLLPIYRGHQAWDPRLFFSMGIVLFSGSLYLLATTAREAFGAITPLGGICFLIGWALVVIRPGQSS